MVQACFGRRERSGPHMVEGWGLMFVAVVEELVFEVVAGKK